MLSIQQACRYGKDQDLWPLEICEAILWAPNNEVLFLAAANFKAQLQNLLLSITSLCTVSFDHEQVNSGRLLGFYVDIVEFDRRRRCLRVPFTTLEGALKQVQNALKQYRDPTLYPVFPVYVGDI